MENIELVREPCPHIDRREYAMTGSLPVVVLGNSTVPASGILGWVVPGSILAFLDIAGRLFSSIEGVLDSSRGESRASLSSCSSAMDGCLRSNSGDEIGRLRTSSRHSATSFTSASRNSSRVSKSSIDRHLSKTWGQDGSSSSSW